MLKIILAAALFASISCVSETGEETEPTEEFVGEARVDACGSGSTSFVPDSQWGVNFWKACYRHDTCYSTCGAPKSTCDTRFLKDMRAACLALPNLTTPQCLAKASQYHLAVKTFGGTPYREGQEDGCAR